jgi:RND family efflux transporter MFP subunit
MLKIIFWSPVLLAAVLCGSACSREKLEAKADAPKIVVAPVAKAAPADLTRELVMAAEFRPFQETDLHAKVAGYLKKINVDVGDRVQQGQLIAVLEIPEMNDDLTRAAAAKRRSDAEVQRARDELERAESAHAVSHLTFTRLSDVSKTRPNLVAQQEIDEALGRDRVSEAGISAARSALAAAEQQVEVAKADIDRVKTLAAYAQITAPFSGVITKRYADTGAMIQAGTASNTQAMPVVRLSENHLLRLVLPVPESVAPRIHTGARVEVRVPTLKRSFPGKVARFAERVQASTRTMETEVDVLNPQLLLIPGMYAEVVLTLDRKKDALAVPLGAIAGHDSSPKVLVVNAENRLEERTVTLGIETANMIEITSGLQPDELVIVGSRSQFKAGQLVQPKIVEMAEIKGER